MKDMNIKQILGANAHWTVNKELANKIGLMPTVLLQHLIDLDQSFFEGKEGGFYQQQDRLLKDLPLTLNHLRKSTKELSNHGLIEVNRKGVPPKYFYKINYDNLCTLLNITFKDTHSKRLENEQERLRIKDIEETKNLKTNTDDDFYGKIFFKIVDNYPANRIGNRQHGLEKFKKLSKENAKLSIINLKRYLASVSEPRYVKTLQNYITEECWTEAWLLAEENKNKVDTKYKADGKTISITHTDKF